MSLRKDIFHVISLIKAEIGLLRSQLSDLVRKSNSTVESIEDFAENSIKNHNANLDKIKLLAKTLGFSLQYKESEPGRWVIKKIDRRKDTSDSD